MNENNSNTFKIGFGLFDILFLLCTFYVWYFSKLVAIESLANDFAETAAPIDNKISNDNRVIDLISNDSSNQNSNENRTILPNNTNLGENANPPKPAKIGFTFGNLDKAIDKITTNISSDLQNNVNSVNNIVKDVTCNHCGIIYVKKHHKQKFCCESCRIAAWELRTNVKLHTSKK
jgi:hypothetical protein